MYKSIDRIQSGSVTQLNDGAALIASSNHGYQLLVSSENKGDVLTLPAHD